ncbi:MAG: hypothetical protein R3D26_16435 [Cyanobacteriota/Melainabacteria group bacterium]
MDRCQEKELVDSRIQSTRLLVDSFKKMEKKPSVFICASAIGFYGERGDEELTEESSAGSGFLADLCKDWEKEAAKAEALGIWHCDAHRGSFAGRWNAGQGSAAFPDGCRRQHRLRFTVYELDRSR